jgi:hypothetical protein
MESIGKNGDLVAAKEACATLDSELEALDERLRELAKNGTGKRRQG